MSPQTRTWYPWYVVAMLLLVSMLGYVDRLVLSLLVGPIKHELALNDTQVGMLTGMAFAVLYVIAGVPIGRMMDRANRVVLLVCCIAIWSAATAGGGLATSFLLLFLARTCVGAGEAGVSPAAVALIGDYFPPQKVQLPLSIYTVGLFAGGGAALILGAEAVAFLKTLGPITLPWLGTLSAWRVTFLGLGIPGLLIGALVLATVKDAPRRTRHVTVDQPAVSAGDQPAVSALDFARRRRRLLTLVVFAVVAWGFNSYGFINWYPEMLMRSFGLSPAAVAHTYGVIFLVGGTLGCLAPAPVTRWIARAGRSSEARPHAVFLASTLALTLLAVASTIAPLMRSAAAALAWTALSVVSQSFVVAAVYRIIVVVAPPALRGIYTGFYMSIMNITGGAFGAVLVGVLTDKIFGTAHLHYSLALVAAVFGPAAALLMLLAGREFLRENRS